MADPRPILTAAETRAAEQRLIDAGTSVATLMERAGAAVAEAAWRVAGPVPVLVVCGPGNNGGDGYVAARLLRTRGLNVRVAASAPPRGAAACAAAAWDAPVEPLEDAVPAPLLIDGVFGTGLSRPPAQEVARALARLADSARHRLAIDLPSGIASDDGALLGEVPRFDLTVALGALKPAHRLQPAAARCGRVVAADIGLIAETPRLAEIARPRLRSSGPEDNKYSRGKVAVVAGAMPGAALLCATAAQRAGAGYVELIGAAGEGVPHALVRRAWDPAALDDARTGALVIGPGLGRDGAARARLDAALASGRPLVIDADALTLIGRARHDRLRGAIVTPHWGEFVRLFGDDRRDRLTQARAAAAASGAIVLLKGADSIVAHPDGRAAIAAPSSAWLASAGTGDALAGIIGALLAAGHDPFAAAQGAVWLHDAAARRAGPLLIADDIIAALRFAARACL